MVTFEQTNEGHNIHHNDKAERDTATIIHKDVSSAAEDQHIMNARHWQIITYTIKHARYIVANCHLPPSWQPMQEWEDSVEELCRNMKQQQNQFPKNCTIGAGDFNCEWPQWQDVPEEWQGEDGDMKSYTLGLKLQEVGSKVPAINVENTGMEKQGTYGPGKKQLKMYDHMWRSVEHSWDGMWTTRWRSDHLPVCATSRACASCVACFAPQAPSLRGWTPSVPACARLARDWAERTPHSLAEVQSKCQ